MFGGEILFAVHKTSREVFKKWNKWQEVYGDVNFSELKKDINDSFLTQFRKIYENNFALLCPLTPFLKVFTNGQINENGYQLKLPIDAEFVNKVAVVYDLFETSMPGFIDYLKQSNFATALINGEEIKTHYDLVINKYKAFVQLLVPHLEGYIQAQALFGLANRLFEYCFESKTFNHYQELLQNAANYPIARFLNAAIWYHMVGDGWKHWHQNCLDAVKERADKGCETIYIAGGTDIYQLLRHGVYNIRVIDPFLPTQVRYYSEGWLWLIKGAGDDGGLGDSVSLSFEKRHIVMKREAYSESDKFFVKGSNNQVLELKKSVTVWKVYDVKNNPLGVITFERRLVDQSDFAALANRTLLFSYDEAVCISSPDMLNGWGIDPTKLSDDVIIYIKQLRKPLTKDVLCNMRVISMMNLADLKFINLASDPT
jgi:hypothetical protein